MIGVEPIKDKRARRQIEVNNPAAVRRWARHLKITEGELKSAVNKVGNSVVAVRKEMSLK